MRLILYSALGFLPLLGIFSVFAADILGVGAVFCEEKYIYLY